MAWATQASVHHSNLHTGSWPFTINHLSFFAMGIEEPDEDRKRRLDKEKERQLEATRARFQAFSNQGKGGTKPLVPRKTGLFPVILFWLFIGGLLFALMSYFIKPKQATVTARGELVIQRSQDGHFYTLGHINGHELKFMVDTGASLVSVSEAFARKALLRTGRSTTFRTANGERPGRIVDGVSISIGPIVVSNLQVGVGLTGGDDNEALLGQSFLSKFDVRMGKDELVLKPR